MVVSMLIYLDSMIVQYMADYIDYIMMLGGYIAEGDVDKSRLPYDDPKLPTEIQALGHLAFLEQICGDWHYAATPHSMTEFKTGKPTRKQIEFYAILESTWYESGWLDTYPLDPRSASAARPALMQWNLRSPDRLHIAQAMVLNAA
jgi:hypothetical protein